MNLSARTVGILNLSISKWMLTFLANVISSMISVVAETTNQQNKETMSENKCLHPNRCGSDGKTCIYLDCHWTSTTGDLLSVDYYRDVWQEERKHNRTLRDEITELKKDLERARFLAEHLFQMVPRQAWRDSGGDDGQGHYEGEYAAARLEEEIQSWKKET